jgi:hypothetical protein
MILTAAAFIGLNQLPLDFAYPAFAFLIMVIGIGSGLFFSPNSAGIMNSVPSRQRGAAAGMRATFVNSGTVISIGVFFSLMVAGLASSLPSTLFEGLVTHGVPAAVAQEIANLPPVSSLFGALLGYNPMASLLPASVLASLPPDQAAVLTGKTFFPNLIAVPFEQGLTVVFVSAAGMSLLAAAASWLRGGRYVHVEDLPIEEGPGIVEAPEPVVLVAE